MSSTPVKKLPASPGVSSPSVPVADRGGEEVNVGFGDFKAGRSNQLRNPRLGRVPGNDRKFSLGNELHTGPLLQHIKDVMCYIPSGNDTIFLRLLEIILRYCLHAILAVYAAAPPRKPTTEYI